MSSAPQSIGKYQVRATLGVGGMGMVYRCFDPDLEREVAVKVLRSDFMHSQRRRQRMAMEARALATLSHLQVVQVYSYESEHEPPFLVMEFIPGRDLHLLVQQEGPFSSARFRDCAWQALSGLGAAHAAGVLHRDLKPSNIILAENGTYKLVDFGLARTMELEQGLTACGELIGTMRYLAPEIISGQEPSAQSDLYSLGLTFYELLTATHAFHGDKGLDLFNRIVHEAPVALSTLRPELPTGLIAWVERLMAKDPIQRFSSCVEALSQLDSLAEADSMSTHLSASESPTVITTERTSLSTVLTHEAWRPQRKHSTNDTKAPNVVGFQKVRWRFLFKLLVMMWVLCSIAVFVSGFYVATTSLSIQQQRWQEELIGLANAGALIIDADRLVPLVPAPHALESEWLALQSHSVWKETQTRLASFCTSIPSVQSIYLMVPTPGFERSGQVRFFLDASREEDLNTNGILDPHEARATPGTIYNAKERNCSNLLKGFDAPIADDAINEDQWGESLSGYVPLRTSSGSAIALIGIDGRGKTIRAQHHAFVFRTILMELAMLVAFLLSAVLISLRLNKPLSRIHSAMMAVAGGDMQARVEVPSSDEFGQIGRMFNHMVEGLRERDLLRRSFERSLAGRWVSGQRSDAITQNAVVMTCLLRKEDVKGRSREQIQEVIQTMVEAVFHYGGVAEELLDGGFRSVFLRGKEHAKESDTKAEERAIRAAVRMQQTLSALQAHSQENTIFCAIGISARRDTLAGKESRAIADVALAQHVDVLSAQTAFWGIRHMFYADRYRSVVLTTGTIDLFAVKGPIAG